MQTMVINTYIYIILLNICMYFEITFMDVYEVRSLWHTRVIIIGVMMRFEHACSLFCIFHVIYENRASSHFSSFQKNALTSH